MNKTRRCTVLLTAGGGAGVPGVIRCLRNNGERDIRIVVTDMSPDTASFYLADNAYLVPSANDPDYADSVLEIVRRENVDIVFVSIVYEMLPLANRRADFEKAGTYLNL